jgi:hypothetical protein
MMREGGVNGLVEVCLSIALSSFVVARVVGRIVLPDFKCTFKDDYKLGNDEDIATQCRREKQLSNVPIRLTSSPGLGERLFSLIQSIILSSRRVLRHQASVSIFFDDKHLP